MSISPELAERIFATVRAGGLAALRAVVGEFIRENHDGRAVAPPDLQQLTARQWKELRKRFPKRTDAARHLACDVKTVSKHASTRLGSDPWVKALAGPGHGGQPRSGKGRRG
jgi:hypothetical protein